MSTPLAAVEHGHGNDQETQEADLEANDDQQDEEEGGMEDEVDSQPAIFGGKKKRERKEPIALVREPGKSLFPFARVQKIIKADKDIPIIARDATFLISLATEEFIKRLCESGKRVAEREKRATVQHKDIATVVRKADEFLFLEEIIPWMSSDPPVKRKLKEVPGVRGAPTLLDQFVVGSKVTGGDDDFESADVVMNEDGTMFVAGGDMDDDIQ